jgi:hypothetical protein
MVGRKEGRGFTAGREIMDVSKKIMEGWKEGCKEDYGRK